MKVVITARSTSTRFPDKSMADINGDPMIALVYTRCKEAWNNVIVAIPDGDPLRDYFYKNNVPFFEGSENDVLDRVYRCAKSHGATWVTRVTGDCPLVNVATLSFLINCTIRKKLDFMTNLPCPDGWDIEIASMRCLEWANQKAVGADREHVMSYVHKNLDKFEKLQFNHGRYQEPVDMASFPKISVDTPEDLERVNKIVKGWV